MSESNHTEGPWSYGRSADSTPHFYFHVGPERALQWHLESWGDRKVREADARLIAAAPEMYEALKALVAEIRAFSSPECDDEGAIGAAELKAADAAIAKAEGNQ